jgi:hypothetical protein
MTISSSVFSSNGTDSSKESQAEIKKPQIKNEKIEKKYALKIYV